MPVYYPPRQNPWIHFSGCTVRKDTISGYYVKENSYVEMGRTEVTVLGYDLFVETSMGDVNAATFDDEGQANVVRKALAAVIEGWDVTDSFDVPDWLNKLKEEIEDA